MKRAYPNYTLARCSIVELFDDRGDCMEMCARVEIEMVGMVLRGAGEE